MLVTMNSAWFYLTLKTFEIIFSTFSIPFKAWPPAVLGSQKEKIDGTTKEIDYLS